MLIQESYINQTAGYRFGDSEPYEPYTDNIKELFQSMQREYGRCTGKIYIDPDATPIGWVFEKKLQYEDTKEFYTREVWVTLLDEPDTVTRTHHYHKLES